MCVKNSCSFFALLLLFHPIFQYHYFIFLFYIFRFIFSISRAIPRGICHAIIPLFGLVDADFGVQRLSPAPIRGVSGNNDYNYITATTTTKTAQQQWQMAQNNKIPKECVCRRKRERERNRGLRHQRQQFMCLFNGSVVECPPLPAPSPPPPPYWPSHRHRSLPRPAPIIDRSDRSNRHAVSHTNC